MLVSSRPCEIRRTSDRLEIISILQQNSSVIQSSDAILIGSRAARKFLPNLRNENESLIDYDIISFSTYLLEWLHKNDEAINTIEMIIPTLNEDQLDLYVTCILKDKSKYDFAVPRSSTSYTAYLLNNLSSWSYSNGPRYGQKGGHLAYAEAKLLLILKKYMLYYPHQWEKTAKDYQELLTIIDPLNDKDKELCDLFIRYNEKLHGKRSLDTSEFVITLHNNEQNIVIRRDEFFQYQKDEQIWCVYQAASKMSIDGDFLIGLEYICTKSPPWLADFVINNWMNIQNEAFKHKVRLSHPCIQFEISNYRLFEQLPEFVIQQILSDIIDPLDFYSMKFVCKNWYTILSQQSFWHDMYLFRYGHYSGDVSKVISWKLLYSMKLENKIKDNKFDWEQLIDATIRLRQTTASNVLRLWEDLTGQNQSVNSDLLSQIDHILSNSYYYHISDYYYSVKLVVIGLDHPRSRSNVTVNLCVGEYGSSYFTDHMEQVSVKFDDNYSRSLSFMGPELFGYYMNERSYEDCPSYLLWKKSSTICPIFPSGIIICLFIMMIHPAHRARFISYLKTKKEELPHRVPGLKIIS